MNGLNRKLLLALGIAAVIAVMIAFWLWSQEPKYKVLFSNYSDKDGGAIVAVLEQMNIPYKVSDGGSAIMVPADQVHQARLKLAAMGLPKGGNIGFELLEKQGFGVSQFIEQVNYQRAVEGELERSIQAISVVENARVHLAIPKSTVFLRDQQKPTASVLVKLQVGRSLERQQVSAVLHLVASSVPGLLVTNVSIIDQNGDLLSDTSKDRANQVDPSQLKYVEDLQKGIAARVESIITPIVGLKNVLARANAEIDFSSLEEAKEEYKPNKNADAAVIRSQQTNESSAAGGGAAAGGVPGALTNQPGANATAPIVNDPNAVGATDAAPAAGPTSKNTTVNYEVDKTVRYTQKTTGVIKRLSVAVVVNQKQELKDGKVVSRALTDDEKNQITELAKQAMGYNETRGDTISVVNSAFVPEKIEELPAIPIWRNPEIIEPAKDFGKLALGVIVLFILYQRALKPMVTKLIESLSPQEEVYQAQPALLEGETAPLLEPVAPKEVVPVTRNYADNLAQAKALATENPKLVANVVSSWIAGTNNG